MIIRYFAKVYFAHTWRSDWFKLELIFKIYLLTVGEVTASIARNISDRFAGRYCYALVVWKDFKNELPCEHYLGPRPISFLLLC